MFGPARSAAAAYAKVDLESKVASADPHGLILMLYDGAIMSVGLAESALQSRNIAVKSAQISKAIRIIHEGLRASLDVKQGGDLGASLDGLYVYMSSKLLFANAKNDAAALGEVRSLLLELRGAWAAIRENKVTPASGTMPHAGAAPGGGSKPLMAVK